MRPSMLFVTTVFALAFIVEASHAERGSRSDGRITVIAGESGERGPSPRFYAMDADGKNVRYWLGWVYDAAFSPDGRLVAYDRIGPAPVHGSYEREIWVFPVENSRQARRLVRNGSDVDWSPSSDAIAFDRVPKGGGIELWVKDIRSGAQRRIVRNASTSDWSPDGTKLAFVRGSDIWVVDIGSKTTRRVIRNGDYPRWSPAGDRIAFVRETRADGGVYITTVDGSGVRRVGFGDSVAWSPDGRELAVTEFHAVTRIHPDGTGRRVVHRGCCAWRGVDWIR